MEGFLLKSPEAKQDLATLDGFSMAQWRRRFFVLVDDRVEYFVDESRKERKGEIRLSHDAFVTGHLGVANHPHMLELTTNYRTYYLQVRPRLCATPHLCFLALQCGSSCCCVLAAVS
eukprot:m.11889 g.11889  ORF g.11889 m.11889 type:complete len:117 (-) comp3187_c0_seq1:579-929(-)